MIPMLLASFLKKRFCNVHPEVAILTVGLDNKNILKLDCKLDDQEDLWYEPVTYYVVY